MTYYLTEVKGHVAVWTLNLTFSKYICRNGMKHSMFQWSLIFNFCVVLYRLSRIQRWTLCCAGEESYVCQLRDPWCLQKGFCYWSACACELVITNREKLHATKGYEWPALMELGESWILKWNIILYLLNIIRDINWRQMPSVRHAACVEWTFIAGAVHWKNWKEKVGRTRRSLVDNIKRDLE